MTRCPDTTRAVRPTRHRLAAALAIATVIIAATLALLASVIGTSASVVIRDAASDSPLTVHIRDERDAAKPAPEPDSVQGLPAVQDTAASARSVAIDNDRSEKDDAAAYLTGAVDVSRPAKDWQAIAKLTAKATFDDLARQEAARDTLWHQTHSVMFQPSDSNVIVEEAPLLANVKFIPRVHVLGLGVTIGSCFIGLPFLGVPLDKRATSGITLFVCADEAD